MKDMFEDIVEMHQSAAANIKEVSANINIIAINAAIESAHAATGVRKMMESVLDELMTTICRLLTKVLESGTLSLEINEMASFADWVGVDEIYITDQNGITVGSNNENAYGWCFPEDPKAQAYEFRTLINQSGGVVKQPILTRDIDNAMFKFVGVSRTDQPGIVQIGFRAETITRYQSEIGTIFSIIAREISKLGSEVSDASISLNKITKELSKIRNVSSEISIQ
jgi:methyl-accepting chemotaxis protein